MPQVRDSKTGRYTSGGASAPNPRIQKAKAVGNGTTAPEIKNPIPQLSSDETSAIEGLLLEGGKLSIIRNAPVEEVSLSNVKSMQKTLRADSVKHFANGGSAEELPVMLQTARGEVVIDGNHRVNQALKEGKSTIKAHHSSMSDLFLSVDALKSKYNNK